MEAYASRVDAEAGYRRASSFVLLLPEDLVHNVCFCFCLQPVLRSAKVVGYISLLSLTANIISLLASQFEVTFGVLIELGLIVLELLAIASLFYGLSSKLASYLKPFLIFNLVWCVLLFLLWMSCVFELMHSQDDFTLRILWTTHSFVEVKSKDAFWLSILLLVGLAASICVGLFFLHIVFLAYFFLQKRESFGAVEIEENSKVVV